MGPPDSIGMHTIDWLVVAAYAAFAMWVGLRYSRRAGQSTEEYFLSGRSLPWWIAGTSMVATTFAADTPLVVSGWVRDSGIWKNWLWWCYAVGGMGTVFIFSRYWRRGGVVTTAELAELRYSGRDASYLRGFLGLYQALFKNTIVLCWVLLAGAKILDVILDVDRVLALALLCSFALLYSLLAGFWGVVLTDLLQFAMAMGGAIALAVISWNAVGGIAGLESKDLGVSLESITSFWPPAGEGSWFEPGFWTTPVAALAVYLGLSWWAVESVDGGGVIVQRIAASRDERHGVLASLWFNIANYALRPWPWFLVALASLAVLPHLEVRTPNAGRVVSVEAAAVTIESSGGELQTLSLDVPKASPDWSATAVVKVDDQLKAGALVARSDSERAYPVMMQRYLPVGLLGLVVASLLAAFMSTIDTHVNLAASYYVNDVHRRFLARDKSEEYYVRVARITSACVLLVAAILAASADSIRDLFTFFISLTAGVGPVYILRWMWWRVRASTEIAAMLASTIVTVVTSIWNEGWALGPLAPDGVLTFEGRLCFVVAASLLCSGLSLLLVRKPDPAQLVDFYRKVRPAGAWGPVKHLAGVSSPPGELRNGILGALAALTATWGLMFAIGYWLLGKQSMAVTMGLIAACGAALCAWALPRVLAGSRASNGASQPPE